MEISSSSSTCCFDAALDYLCWMNETLKGHIYFIHYLRREIDDVEQGIRLLQCFDLYLTKCRRRMRTKHETCLEPDEVEKDVTSFRIQNLIIRRMQDLEFACSEYLIHSQSSDPTHIRSKVTNIESELTKFREAIKLFFKTDINESCINSLLEYYWPRDPQLVIDFTDSISKYLLLADRRYFKRLGRKLIFLKSFIRFAILHGVEGQQLTDLLIHAEVVAIKALHLFSIWSRRYTGEAIKEMELQISRLIPENINPHVRETYIHVLTAAKLSRSSDISALEKNKHLVADFMDGLVYNIMELVESCTSTLVPIMNQMLKLLEVLRFLKILLWHQEKFKELCHEMQNLIGVVACDAAVVFFSLSMNQIEESSSKETDLVLSHLCKVFNFIKAEVTDPVASFSPFGFPRTNELGSMNFLLEELKELAISDEINGSNSFPVDKIQTIQQDFEFLISFLQKIKKQRNHDKKLQAFWSRVMEVAYKTELLIDSTLVGDGRDYCLDDVARAINVMKIEAQEIFDSISYVGETKRVTLTRTPSRVAAATYNEDLVHLDSEVETITHRLTRGSRQLDVVPIVGMPGLGGYMHDKRERRSLESNSS